MRVVAGLRRRGIDIRTALDVQLLGSSERGQLEYARQHSRVVATCDTDFLRLAHGLIERSDHHPGVLFVLPETNVGDAVRAIALVATVLEPDEMVDWVEWIP